MSAPRKRPRNLFRARRRGSVLCVGRAPLPAVEAWIEQHRDRLVRPGAVIMLQTWHDADCPYPQSHNTCTCRTGPEIRVAGEDPEGN